MPEFDQLTIQPTPVHVEDWNKKVKVINDFIARVGEQLGDKTLTIGDSKIFHKDGALKIKNTLTVLNKNTDANGETLVLGPFGQSNLRLGYHQNYSWIQSHHSKPLAINPIGNNVGIGTTAPKFRVHISTPKNHGHLLLEDRDKKTGLHFHVNADTAFISNRNNFAKNGTSKNSKMVLSTPNTFQIQTGNPSDPYVGTPRLTILKDGKTGIGTNQPKNTLHLKGNKGMLLLEGTKAAHIGFYPKGMNYLNGYMGFASVDNNNLFMVNRVADADIVIAGNRDLILKTKKIKAPVGGKSTNLHPPILFKKYTFKQSGNNKVAFKSTAIAHKNWTAAIVGFSTGIADIGEQGTGTSMEVKMVKLDAKNNWYIQANLRTHDNKYANWTVQVMFVQNQFCNVDDDYDAADPTPTTGIPNWGGGFGGR